MVPGTTTIHQLHNNNFILIIQSSFKIHNRPTKSLEQNTFASLGCSSVLVSFFLAVLLFGVLSAAAAAFVFFSSIISCRETQFFQFIISKKTIADHITCLRACPRPWTTRSKASTDWRISSRVSARIRNTSREKASRRTSSIS